MFRWLWNPAHYWPYGLLTVFGLFLIREVWALASGRPQDTLSWFAWRQLNIVAGQSPSEWGAAAYLSFGMYLVVVSWLAYHVWFRKFT
jgi:hypothetical protein